MATVIEGPLPLPDPPEGHTWKYALVGEALADSPQGRDLISRLEKDYDGIVVEVLIGGGMTLQTQPQCPREAQLRAFHPDPKVRKP